MPLFRPRNKSDSNTPTNNNNNDNESDKKATTSTTGRGCDDAYSCDPIFCSSDDDQKAKLKNKKHHPFFHNKEINKKDRNAINDNNNRDDGVVPGIEAVASYESASTAASGNSDRMKSPTRTDDHHGSKNTNFDIAIIIPVLQVETSEDDDDDEEEESMYDVALRSRRASTDDDRYNDDDEDQKQQQYFSREELENLLTPRFLEDLEGLEVVFDEEEREMEQQRERQRRKQLIQRELDALVRTTDADMKLEAKDGTQEEFEPEAIEALGIAANRVAYQKRYYDVPSSQYIYVPSVAYTILNGTLLEEASKHYFGDSDEFLVSYAAQLGTTILQNRQPDVMQIQGDDFHNGEDCLSVVDFLSPRSLVEEGDDASSYSSSVANSCFGVLSPRSVGGVAQMKNNTDEAFRLNESMSMPKKPAPITERVSSTKTPTPPSSKSPSNKQSSSLLAIAVVLGLLVLASMATAMILFKAIPTPTTLLPRQEVDGSHYHDTISKLSSLVEENGVVASPANAPLPPLSMDEAVFHGMKSMNQLHGNADNSVTVDTTTTTANNPSRLIREQTGEISKTTSTRRPIVANLLF